jgi:hypothetical protein
MSSGSDAPEDGAEEEAGPELVWGDKSIGVFNKSSIEGVLKNTEKYT